MQGFGQPILGGEDNYPSHLSSCITDIHRDGVTDDQNPIIARHPQHQNLLIAGGASYTHAKDLPEIGLAIVDTLNGKGTASFGWARSSMPQGSHNQPALLAHMDFEELEHQASQSAEVERWKESGSECYI